jgi:alpha-amylase
VNSKFGTEADLVALSNALHSRGMYLMADIVTNHMAFRGCGTCVDYSTFSPFSSQSYFHPYCSIDYNNETSIQQCWQGDNIVALPDLRTENQNVRDIWNNWIAQMVSKYKIDGLRIDSAKHQEKSFWPGFEAAAGVYMAGEVLNGDPAYVAPYQSYMSGLLNYPLFYWATQAFQSTSGSISNLANGINSMKSQAANLSLYGSFLENHDQQRFSYHTSDMALAKNAIALTMLMDGIPIIYQGQEQHYAGGDVPYNREALWSSGYNTGSELYSFIASMNKLRSRAIQQDPNYLEYRAWPIYSDSHVIALRKGFDGFQVVSVYANVGSSGSFSVNLASSATGFKAGDQLVEVVSCSLATAESGGQVSVASGNGQPKVYYPLARLGGSGICPGITGMLMKRSSCIVRSLTEFVNRGCYVHCQPFFNQHSLVDE